MRRRLFGLAAACLFTGLAASNAELTRIYGDSATVDGNVHGGVEVQIDLPKSQHVHNVAAPKDGLGNCVWASGDMCARWHNVRELIDLVHKVEYGGGYPGKVDKIFKELAPNLKYVQYEGNDPAILDKALSENHAAGVTYGYGERYGMQKIQHMVLLVHFDKKWAAIIDNNFPGTFEWMPREEFLKRWKHGTGQGWAYVMLAPPPPPPPRN